MCKARIILSLIAVITIALSQPVSSNPSVQKKNRLLKSKTQSYVTRLHPNQDIMETLTNLLKNKNHKAITISTATGSVLYCHIRFANMSFLTKVNGPLQITSITGTFDRNLKPHLHIAVADGSGRAFGGHLPSLSQRSQKQQEEVSTIGYDCPIYTTLELSLTIHKDVIFERKKDLETTYDELTIMPFYEPYWLKKQLPEQQIVED